MRQKALSEGPADCRFKAAVMKSIPALAPLLASKDDKALPRLVEILEATQLQSPAEREAQQLAQLDGFIRLIRAQLPGSASRFTHIDPKRPLTWRAFRSIPLLTRAALQDAGDSLELPRRPPGFEITGQATTSGSTGTPVTTRSTWGMGALNRAIQIRIQRLHRFDFDATCAFITAPTPAGRADPPHGRSGEAWAAPFGSGRGHQLNLLASTDDQLDWLARLAPKYFATYPSNLHALLLRSRERGVAPRALEQIILSSEPVSPELVQLCRDTWNARVLLTYSSNEVGAMAFGLPDEDELIVQSENVLLEVLRDDGSACEPGEVGRVVVTTLQDFLRPLVRYEIGDYAEVGTPVDAATSLTDASALVRLPRLRRVLGRQRTMITLPDGRRVWPHFEFARLVELGCLRQWQLVQKKDRSLEVRVVPLRELAEADFTTIHRVVADALPGIDARVVCVDAIARSPRGKYLELISELDT